MAEKRDSKLRESALRKLDGDEAVALMGPFIELAANTADRKGTVEVRWRGPTGEEWTLAEWMNHVSNMLRFGHDSGFKYWYNQQIELSEQNEGRE